MPLQVPARLKAKWLAGAPSPLACYVLHATLALTALPTHTLHFVPSVMYGVRGRVARRHRVGSATQCISADQRQLHLTFSPALLLNADRRALLSRPAQSIVDGLQRWPKGWGTPFDSFWCCYGTAVESFAKLADDVFFWRAGDGPQVSARTARNSAQGACRLGSSDMSCTPCTFHFATDGVLLLPRRKASTAQHCTVSFSLP